MKIFKFLISWIIIMFTLVTVNSQSLPEIENKAFDTKVSSLLKFNVPTINVDELYDQRSKYLLFDARELEEYNISHIEGARCIGYSDWDKSLVSGIDKETPIVIYCSIGYRSEKIAEQLSLMGFKYVFNLYGSIFEWANRGYPLVEAKNLRTNKIHTYNRLWGQWILNSDYIKIY